RHTRWPRDWSSDVCSSDLILAIRIIHLRPPRDPRFDQMSKMIKWDGLLVALGAFAPLRPRTDQADVALQGIPQLRQLIEAKFPKIGRASCRERVENWRVGVIVCLIPVPTHRPEFQKNESFPV